MIGKLDAAVWKMADAARALGKMDQILESIPEGLKKSETPAIKDVLQKFNDDWHKKFDEYSAAKQEYVTALSELLKSTAKKDYMLLDVNWNTKIIIWR